MSTSADLEQTILFDRLQAILSGLYQKVTDQLEIFPQADQPFQSFRSFDGSASGSLQTFSGQEVDKLVHSWLNASQLKFSMMRLTLWLGSHIQVPHLAFEFGTIPNLFFYMDYIPRVDLWSDLRYIEQYYEPLNSTYLALRNQPNLAVFVSKAFVVRQLQSPAHLCFTGSGTEESLALVQKTAHEWCDRWLTWVEQATPVPAEAQAALAERDLKMRRISAERDPGNAMAAKLFGPEFTNQLVERLWSQEPRS